MAHFKNGNVVVATDKTVDGRDVSIDGTVIDMSASIPSNIIDVVPGIPEISGKRYTTLF